MYNKLRLLAFLLFIGFFTLSGSASAAPSDKTSHDKVVMISFDGMRNDLTRKYITEGKLPSIKKVMDNGIMAESSKTITPSLTAPSHAAIATGATPSKTGFVSNQWHEPETELLNTKDAFKNRLQVNPLWVEAKKQGKTTATVAFAGANPTAGHQGNYSVYYGETWSPSNLEKLSFKEAHGWKYPGTHFGPLFEASFEVQMEKAKNQIIHVLAVDSTNDGKRNYLTFILSDDKQVDEKDAVAERDEWASLPLPVKGGLMAGFWFKFKETPDDLNGVTMYRTAVSSGVIDGPHGFAKDIHDTFGFFPVQDDSEAFNKGWISREEYEQISTRFVDWVTDVSLYIKNKYKPDLLMFYAPQIDHEEHQFLLTDPRQPGYTKEKSKKYMGYVEWSYKLADQVVGRTLESLKSRDHLFIVSDHGMEPAHSMLNPNHLLKKAGLLKLDEEGKIDSKNSSAYAVSSSGTAHVYINVKEREKGGAVPWDDYEEVEKKIVQLFRTYQIKPTGKFSYFKHTIRETAESIPSQGFNIPLYKENAINLYHYLIEEKVHPYKNVIITKRIDSLDNKHSGDILLLAGSGYVMGKDYKKAVTPTLELGTHGGDPDREKLKPVFLAIGDRIEKDKTIHPISNLDIAPTVYSLLGLRTPSFVEGKKIKEGIKE
ncbi:alkaline phosphatase family protein [Peribacillus glennii]|uniref:Alkaline phosphatase family protein n=1 Tax=Peribacillus glennii TaxID=2303991 RepID=A0A372L895_9BACI|nr:alkaline phosphatase family protein [Peribacillus glennii]RFU61107.1 alkaline phosphatase family protein [Peribacillus glennii]